MTSSEIQIRKCIYTTGSTDLTFGVASAIQFSGFSHEQTWNFTVTTPASPAAVSAMWTVSSTANMASRKCNFVGVPVRSAIDHVLNQSGKEVTAKGQTKTKSQNVGTRHLKCVPLTTESKKCATLCRIQQLQTCVQNSQLGLWPKQARQNKWSMRNPLHGLFESGV